MTRFDHSFDFGKDRYHQRDEMISWCRANVGQGGYIPHEYNSWEIATMFGNSTFRFKNEQDLTMFLLRWA